MRASRLVMTYQSPWDRMIVATVFEHGLSLVTKDKRIWDRDAVLTIWRLDRCTTTSAEGMLDQDQRHPAS